jgi:hypothetical protein
MSTRLSPARLAAVAVLAVRTTLAEALWASTFHGAPGLFGEDTDDRLASFLGLGAGDGHDELTRCEVPGCGVFFWADEGAELVHESEHRLQVCAAHAFPDDPGCRLYPGVGLEARWRDERSARESELIRTTGSPW